MVVPMPTTGENVMITGVSIVTVWVLDTESAKEFYTKRLGFDLTNDIQLDSGMRWLTVRAPGSPGQGSCLSTRLIRCSTRTPPCKFARWSPRAR